MEKIGIIGTGNVGSSLGARFRSAGYPVCFGVRKDKDVSDLLQRVGASKDTPAGAASWADVVFLAVPGKTAVEAARDLGELTGKVLVDCTNPVAWKDGPIWDPPEEGSSAEAIAAAVRATVVKAFNTFGAEFHLDPALGEGGIDVQLAGDDADAKAKVAEIAQKAEFTPVDCGPLRNAALLENLAVLWIHLAMVERKERNIGFKLLTR